MPRRGAILLAVTETWKAPMLNARSISQCLGRFVVGFGLTSCGTCLRVIICSQDRMVMEDDIALYGEYISPDATALKVRGAPVPLNPALRIATVDSPPARLGGVARAHRQTAHRQIDHSPLACSGV